MTYFGKIPVEKFTWGQFGIWQIPNSEVLCLRPPFWMSPSQKSISRSYHSLHTPPRQERKRETGHVLGRTDPLWVPNLYAERHQRTNWWPNVTSPKLQHRALKRMPHSGSQDDGWARAAAGCTHSHCLPLSKSQESRKKLKRKDHCRYHVCEQEAGPT